MTGRQTRTGRSDRQWRDRQSGRTDTHALAGQSLAEHKRQTGRTGVDCQDRQTRNGGTEGHGMPGQTVWQDRQTYMGGQSESSKAKRQRVTDRTDRQ